MDGERLNFYSRIGQMTMTYGAYSTSATTSLNVDTNNTGNNGYNPHLRTMDNSNAMSPSSSSPAYIHQGCARGQNRSPSATSPQGFSLPSLKSVLTQSESNSGQSTMLSKNGRMAEMMMDIKNASSCRAATNNNTTTHYPLDVLSDIANFEMQQKSDNASGGKSISLLHAAAAVSSSMTVSNPPKLINVISTSSSTSSSNPNSPIGSDALNINSPETLKKSSSWVRKYLANTRTGTGSPQPSSSFYSKLSKAVKSKARQGATTTVSTYGKAATAASLSARVMAPVTLQRSASTHGREKLQNPFTTHVKYNRSGSVKRCWLGEEDEHLMQLAVEYGCKDWAEIAKSFPGRNTKQCRDRWHNQLNPAIKRTPWEADEDSLLVEAHKELGNKWSLIAEMLPGRTPTNVKNRYRTVTLGANRTSGVPARRSSNNQQNIGPLSAPSTMALSRSVSY